MSRPEISDFMEKRIICRKELISYVNYFIFFLFFSTISVRIVLFLISKMMITAAMLLPNRLP